MTDESPPPMEPTAATEFKQRSLFWSCAAVFLALAIAFGFQCATLLQQRQTLKTAHQNALDARAQARIVRRQLEPRLESLSLELLSIAQTNSTAQQIVQQFNISWTPSGTNQPAPTEQSGQPSPQQP